MQQINDLSAKLSSHRSQIDAAIDRVIASGWLVLGPEVSRFEQSFASYIGADHCVGVANGTDALELALRALGVAPGDKVATAANAGMYTTTALLAIGAQRAMYEHNLRIPQDVSLAGFDDVAMAAYVPHNYPLEDLAPPSEEGIAAAVERLRASGLRVNIGG